LDYPVAKNKNESRKEIKEAQDSLIENYLSLLQRMIKANLLDKAFLEYDAACDPDSNSQIIRWRLIELMWKQKMLNLEKIGDCLQGLRNELETNPNCKD
jgi:hypothetical protein